MSRHELQDEREAEEYPTTPPADGGQKISRLPDSDQRVGRRARSAKAGSESPALATLEQNDEDQNDAVDDEQCEKKRVKH
jgi:hypothetical protein